MLESMLLRGETTELEKYALDELLVVAPGGRIETKPQVIAGVGSLEVKAVEITDEKIVFHDDVAVLVGRLYADGGMQPLGKLPPMKFMATFVKTTDGWRLLSGALTPCAQIAIERGAC